MTRLVRCILVTSALAAAALRGLPAWADEPAVVDSVAPQAVDLNHAPAAEIRMLPIPPAVADAIIDYRTYHPDFNSVFDLLEVDGMTPELLARIRPLVIVAPQFPSTRRDLEDAERRVGELNYVVQRLLSEEGASEGLTDEYVDRIRDPENLNRLDYFGLTSYQNVSPVDAVAVLNERSKAGRIENDRQFRAAQGLTYWGFRSLRDFVRYDDGMAASRVVRAAFQTRIYDTPYALDDLDILEENIIGDTNGLTADQKSNFRNYDLNTYAGRLDLPAAAPYLTNKLRVRYGPYFKAALLTHRNLGETRWDETTNGFLSLDALPSRPTRIGPVRLEGLVIGDFTVALGQGLIMDATDYFMARRNGYGYTIRAIGVRGNLSRTDEYNLHGGALEGSLGRMRGTFFYSSAPKDAILNPDGSLNTYIRMVPRLSDDLLAGIRSDIASGMFAGRGDTTAFLPMRHVMDERVAGTNLKVELAPGTYVGVTGVDMRYHNRVFDTPGADRWNPSPTSLVIDPGRLEDRDAEIAAGYDSRALGNYRRIWGSEAQTVWRNLALAGEYAKLETSTAAGALERIFSAGPEAYVGQAYLQYESFNLLALYRDYDLGYDNPYDRAFSENTRFQQTIVDGTPYRLRNAYWAELARQVPQPKAERGWYLSSRFQLTRQLTINGLEYDVWTRKADGADLQRATIRAEYRPIFPLRLRVRQSLSSRHSKRPDDIRNYSAWDTRLELLANLSRYDQLRFLYSTANVMFAERGRLSGPAGGGDVQSDTTATRGDPAHALQGVLTHNFNPFISATISTEIYDGFLYNFEDNEFVVVDRKGFRTWFMFASRLSNRLSWRFKWTSDHKLARTYVDIRNYGVLMAPTPDGMDVRLDRNSFGMQIDYSL